MLCGINLINHSLTLQIVRSKTINPATKQHVRAHCQDNPIKKKKNNFHFFLFLLFHVLPLETEILFKNIVISMLFFFGGVVNQ